MRKASILGKIFYVIKLSVQNIIQLRTHVQVVSVIHLTSLKSLIVIDQMLFYNHY